METIFISIVGRLAGRARGRSVTSAVTGRHIAIKYNVAIGIVTWAYFLAGASAVDIAQQIAAKVVRQ
jgi:hypothetical protein